MPMPSVYAVGAVGSGINAVVASLPAGVQQGDILLMFIENQDAGAVAAITGWSTIIESFAATGNATRLSVRWKRAGTIESGPNVPDPGDHLVVRIVGVRGAKRDGNPYNTSNQATELVSDTTVSVPGGTTTRPNCLVFAAFSTGTDLGANSTTHASNFVNASLTGLTAHVNDWRIDGLGGGIAVVAGNLVNAGTYAATTADVATANFKALISFAIEGEEPRKPRLPNSNFRR